MSTYVEIKGNLIHKTAVIDWDYVEIGIGNKIGPYVCIGEDAQHPTEKSDGIVKIGNNNVLREYITIHRPTSLTKLTSVGNNCYFMEGSHVGHDCTVEDRVRLSNKAILSGHVHVMTGAVLGLGALVHQSQIIGSYTMLGMGAVIPKKLSVTPGYTFVGNPAKLLKKNIIGLDRNSITEDMLKIETDRFLQLKARYQE